MRTFARIAAATLAATLAFGTANAASAAETGHRQPAPTAMHYAPSHEDGRNEGARRFDMHRQGQEHGRDRLVSDHGRDHGREGPRGRGMMRHHHERGGERGHCHGHTGRAERR